MQSSIPE